ncbi:O-antigen ligase family protein [Microbacterium sp. P07]|uniref:O-antigen ligase family protein n=1 Tax=Microbacterium sp. P07 TaxID=3366952 RepID=UPI00374702C1
MPIGLLIAAAVVGFVAVWHFKGGASAAVLAMLGGCALAPITLMSWGEPTTIAAMAAPTITFTTYHLALVGALIALPTQALRNTPPVFFLFLIAVVVLTVARDLVAPHTVSGMVQWASAVAAWGVGGAIAEASHRSHRPTERLIALAIAVVVGWHGAVVALQLFGGRAVRSIEVGASEVARVSGLAGASGNVGKIMFCLILILLPVTRSADRLARRVAIATIVVAALLTGLSYSRANTVAIAALLAIWLLLGAGITLAKRILIPAVAIVLAFPIIDTLVLRNEYDPDGGSRPILTETALRQISETPWLGVGTNNYLNYVGQYDLLTAGGLPVHSAVLLAIAEVGILSFALFLVPLVAAVVYSIRNVGRSSPTRSYALALIAGSPGIVVIATTGWGLIRGQFLVLLLFAIGYLVSAQRARSEGDRQLSAPARPGRARIRTTGLSHAS